MKGERVCLPKIPDEDGRINLDCAIGLRGDDDNFYGLRAADPNSVEPFPLMNRRVRVKGRFIPGGGGRYKIVGDIVYTSIESIDEPKVVTGTLLCVGDEPGAAPSDRCRWIVETAGGLFWGLDADSFDRVSGALPLTPGMRIEVEGTLISEMPEHWHPWASVWAPQSIQGLLEVRRARAVS